MTRHRLTPAAQQDLSDIWDFTEERWGIKQAELYVRKIVDSISFITDDPRRGRQRDEVRKDYLSFPVGSHVLFYRIRPSHIEVIRILHQRMDFHQHF